MLKIITIHIHLLIIMLILIAMYSNKYSCVYCATFLLKNCSDPNIPERVYSTIYLKDTLNSWKIIFMYMNEFLSSKNSGNHSNFCSTAVQRRPAVMSILEVEV